ncbi:hypothetical protein [Kitasatospora sp. NPDC057223]|uniref:hypothetical protein n=1 Tax=Kitasatospora sp. NPDC057223 TaxID=3346055 RepID=UPI00362DC912
MTNDLRDDLRALPPTRAELKRAWRRAGARWSSDPEDSDAYTAFIHAGTALYRHQAPTTPAGTAQNTPAAPLGAPHAARPRPEPLDLLPRSRQRRLP